MATLESYVKGIDDSGEKMSVMQIIFIQLTTNRRHFPEPFLWEMFHYMAEAVLAMALGPQNPDQNASIPLWQFEIVHRDIKPANGES